MTPAKSVAEWLTWAEQIPALDDTHNHYAEEPSPTTMTAADPDGLMAENQQARSFDRFAV